jgi:serine/threonine-protein kinase TTK/MPS1
MSPEALTFSSSKSIKIGRSSDVWSLGCILHQLVFGKPPFAHLPLVQKLAEIVSKERIIIEKTDDCVGEVIEGCLERDKVRRWTIEKLLAHEYLVGRKKELVNERNMIQIVQYVSKLKLQADDVETMRAVAEV